MYYEEEAEKQKKRPHVPIMRITISEHFENIMSGNTLLKVDSDYKSMQDSLSMRKRQLSFPFI